MKARRPWSRTVATYRVPKPIRTFERISSRDGVYGLGQSFRTKLKYVEAVVLQSVAGAVGRNVFSLRICLIQITPVLVTSRCFGINLHLYMVNIRCIMQTFLYHLMSKRKLLVHLFSQLVFLVVLPLIAADPNTNMEDNHGTYTIFEWSEW